MRARAWTTAAAAALLVIAAPAPTTAETPASPASFDPSTFGEPVSPACLSDPQSRLEAVADLLIDGRPVEAKAAAEQLLAAGGLPPRAEARARQLLAKAEALLPPPPPPPPPTPPFPEASFPVRQGEIGGGFSAGTAGTLRLARDGLSFLADGASRAAWTLPWENIADLSRDDGLWDTQHPLVLRQRHGPPRYLALIDGESVDAPPDRLLAAFGRARREAERRRTAAGDATAPPGKEQPR